MEPESVKGRRPRQFLWINLNATHYISVRECAVALGYRVTDSTAKSVINWHDSEGRIDIMHGLKPWQLYNHFPGIWAISRKVELAKNMERMRRMLPEIFSFHPKTFLLPMQYEEMKVFMTKGKKRKTLIVKPDRGSQGKGIIIVQDPSSLDDYVENAVAQTYIPPFLIDGYKFDLRIYVLVTSVEPLRIYIHKEGMARFCSEKYVKPRGGNLTNTYAHLTNYSLNKKNTNFIANEDADECDVGSKRSMSSVFAEIEREGHDVGALQAKIDDIIRLTFASVQSSLVSSYRTAVPVNDGKSRCFEILGFDVMIDKAMDPWLIEVNCMPSLTCDSPFDTDIKHSVIDGTLRILDLNAGFKGAVKRRMKAVMQKRMGGRTDVEIKNLFDPERESEIACGTNWRQLCPLNAQDAGFEAFQQATTMAHKSPVGAAVETQATRARRERVLAGIKEKTELERSYSQKITVKKVVPKTETQQLQRNMTIRKFRVQCGLASPRSVALKLPATPPSMTYRPPLSVDTVVDVFKNACASKIDEREECERQARLQKSTSRARILCLMTYVRIMVGDTTPVNREPIQKRFTRDRRFIVVQQRS